MKQLSQHIESIFGSSIFGEPCGLSFEFRQMFPDILKYNNDYII